MDNTETIFFNLQALAWDILFTQAEEWLDQAEQAKKEGRLTQVEADILYDRCTQLYQRWEKFLESENIAGFCVDSDESEEV